MAHDIKKTLATRKKAYGAFEGLAKISQAIKRAMRDSANWDGLPDDMKEALEMDALKTARIINGKPKHFDNWHDKIGYIKLVADKLEGDA